MQGKYSRMLQQVCAP
jgi:hypothetical protein